VLVLVQVDVKAVARRLPARDHLDASVLHASRREDTVGELLELLGRPLENDHFEAVRRIEMHVHRRAHLRPEPVLQLDEALGEIADVMIVDQRDGRDGIRAFAHLRARDLCAREVAKHLRARALALLHERVERAQERALHGHTEPHQVVALGHARILHDGPRERPPPYSATRMSARPGCPGAPGEPFAPGDPGEPCDPGEPPDAYCVCPL